MQTEVVAELLILLSSSFVGACIWFLVDAARKSPRTDQPRLDSSFKISRVQFSNSIRSPRSARMELRKASASLLRAPALSTMSIFNSSLSSLRLRTPRMQSFIAQTSQSRQYTNTSYTSRPATTTSAGSSSAGSQTTQSTTSESSSLSSNQSSNNAWVAPSNTPSFILPSESGRKPTAGKSSSRELLEHIQMFGTKTSTAPVQSSKFDLSRMEMPSSAAPLDLQGVQNDVSTTVPTVPQVTLRLGSRAGRTVHVNEKTTVIRAIQKMEMLVAKNGVRRDFNTQRYHERPGLRRKRLKAQRWRKNFKTSFQATVRRVQQLTKQGW